MASDLEKLERQLNYQFSDPEIVRLALTHRSAAKPNNERLEFLGDSLLGFIVAELLFETLPEASEGELSRYRSNVVNKSTLAEIARVIELSDHLQLGTGELKSGGRQRESILADTLEALIAAVYLDGGINACKSIVGEWMLPRLPEKDSVPQQKDAKTRLQELMQAEGLTLPEYRVQDIEGEAHQQTFVVVCSVSLLEEPQQGRGSSKRLAEQEAARKILQRLGEPV